MVVGNSGISETLLKKNTSHGRQVPSTQRKHPQLSEQNFVSLVCIGDDTIRIQL